MRCVWLNSCKTILPEDALSQESDRSLSNSVLQETAHGVAILQPGSSVATALSEGEAKKKHVIVLELVDQSFRVVKQELQTVRPFRFEQARASHYKSAFSFEGFKQIHCISRSLQSM